MRRRWIVFAAWLAASPARAQAPEPVESLLRRGIALRIAQNDEGALPLFREAYARQPDPRSAGQLGLAEQALGRWLDAERHLREAVAAGDDPWVRRNRVYLDEALAANASHVAQLVLLGGVAGASVRLDGVAVGALPLPEPLRALAGAVTLELRAEGYYDLSRRLVLAPGINREDVAQRPLARAEPPPAPAATPAPTVAPAPIAPVAPPPTPHPRRPSPPGAALRIGGWTAVSLALAAGVLGALALASRNDAATAYNADCPAEPPAGQGPSTLCGSLTDRGALMTALSITGFTLAGVGAAAGTTLLILDGARR